MRQRILLTGDDGYTSLGIRLLARVLREEHNLTICAPQSQQSAVGGKLSLQRPTIAWGEEVVEGVTAVWVDGTPGDCMEFAQGYFPEPFDCVISGINIGPNTGGHISSSGTFAAAWRALVICVAPKALAISWDAPLSIFTTASSAPDLTTYIHYPGRVAGQLVKEVFSQAFWEAPFLNINFPLSESHTAVFTHMLPNLLQSDCYPNSIDRKKRVFSYPYGMSAFPNRDISYDFGALLSGKISITPCNVFPQNEEVLGLWQGREGSLE